MPPRAMIIVAAGAGTRFGGDKMAADVGGRALLEITVDSIVGLVSQLVVVGRPGMIPSLDTTGVVVVPGGRTRTASEVAGLKAVSPDAELIGIHDGARPLVSPRLVEELFAAAERVGGAVPVLSRPMVERGSLRPLRGAAIAQTPQVFRASSLRDAYRMAARDGIAGHDTAEVVARYTDLTIAAVAGDEENLKVTFPADLETIRERLRN